MVPPNIRSGYFIFTKIPLALTILFICKAAPIWMINNQTTQLRAAAKIHLSCGTQAINVTT